MSGEPVWIAVLALATLGGILSGAPVMLAIAGMPLLVALAGAAFGAFDLTFLRAYPSRVFGVMNNTLLIAVPLFVLMGALLERAAIAERMLRDATALLGGSQRAMALSVLFISLLIAASTGIIAATVVMLGLIALPALLQTGVPARTAAGLVCASGTLGQIVPPSIVLILLGDQVANAYLEAQQIAGNFAPDPVTIGDLFAGALVPSLVLVGLFALWLLVVLRGPGEQADGPPGSGALAGLLVNLVPPVLLIVAVLGAILAGVATPTEAAAIGVAGTALLAAASPAGDTGVTWWPRWVALVGTAAAFGLVGLRVAGVPAGPVALAGTLLVVGALAWAAVRLARGGVLLDAMRQTVRVTAMIFGIILAASMLALVFRGFGGDGLVERWLEALPGDATGMLLVTLAVIFLMGFLLDFVEIVFIVVPIVGPVLLQQIDPVWFAVLVALNLQTSFLTPPFGFALFYVRSVAPPAITTALLYRAVLPFVVIQLLALLAVFLLPGLATWLPSVLFG